MRDRSRSLPRARFGHRPIAGRPAQKSSQPPSSMRRSERGWDRPCREPCRRLGDKPLDFPGFQQLLRRNLWSRFARVAVFWRPILEPDACPKRTNRSSERLLQCTNASASPPAWLWVLGQAGKLSPLFPS